MFEAFEQVAAELQERRCDGAKILNALLRVTASDGMCAGRTVSEEALAFESALGQREYAVPDAHFRFRRILAVLIQGFGVEPNGGAETFTTFMGDRPFKLSVELSNTRNEASFVLRRLEWLEPGADAQGRVALAARRLLGAAQGLAVVDSWLAADPDSRYFVARVSGEGGELVRRDFGRERRFPMSRKSLEALVESLRAAGIFELEDAPEELLEVLDGHEVGVAMSWGEVRRSREVVNPPSHRGLAAAGRILDASDLALRFRCFWGKWR